MLKSKKELKETAKFIYSKLDDERTRTQFLEDSLIDSESNQDYYDNSKIIVELSREYFGHPDPALQGTETDKPVTNKSENEVRVSA